MPLLVPSSDGVTVAVHDIGPPMPDGAPVVLLCHANGFCGGAFAPLAARLGDGYRLLAMDFRGHGDSSRPPSPDADWPAFGDDVEAVLDSPLVSGAQAVHGIGHSLGGGALLMAASRRPGGFRSLWVYEPIAPPPDSFGRATGTGNPLVDATLRRRRTFESAEAAVANYASKPPLSSLHPEALQAYVDWGFRTLPDGSVELKCDPEWEAAVFGGGRTNRAFDEAGEVTVPATVAMGRDDQPGPALFAPSVAARVPGALLARHPELGHFGPLQDPDRIARDILAWLAGS